VAQTTYCSQPDTSNNINKLTHEINLAVVTVSGQVKHQTCQMESKSPLQSGQQLVDAATRMCCQPHSPPADSHVSSLHATLQPNPSEQPASTCSTPGSPLLSSQPALAVCKHRGHMRAMHRQVCHATDGATMP
jgi:hypothetical protein